jgi:integrase
MTNSEATKGKRGFGRVFQPTYKDRATGERKPIPTWWIQYSIRGKRIRESVKSTNRADAVRLLKTRIAQAQSGRPVGPQIERTTFEDLATILTDNYKANGRKSLASVEDRLKSLRAFFIDYKARDITADRLTAYVAQRQQAGAQASTINRELSALRRAFTLAEIAGKVASCPRFPMLKEHNARKGFFEPPQFQALIDELPACLKPVFQCAYMTGWRTKSELLTRRWEHVDFDAGWLVLDPGEAKNEEARRFPLTPELRAVLESQRERVKQIAQSTCRPVPWVFPHDNGSPIKDCRKAFNNACDRAGLVGRIPHDFRRTAVRNLERAGVPRSAAMKLTGHKTESVYQRYAIVDSGMLKEAAVKLAALHAGENRAYGMTPGQIERLAASAMLIAETTPVAAIA